MLGDELLAAVPLLRYYLHPGRYDGELGIGSYRTIGLAWGPDRLAKFVSVCFWPLSLEDRPLGATGGEPSLQAINYDVRCI